jgi:hypothetical protein
MEESYCSKSLMLKHSGFCCIRKESCMSHAIEFIETSLFTRQFKSIATDDELRISKRNSLPGLIKAI